MDKSTEIIIVCVCAGIFLIATLIVVVCCLLRRRCKKTEASPPSPRTSSTRQLSPGLSDGYSGRQIVITPEQYTSNSHAYTYDYDNAASPSAIGWPPLQYRPNAAKIDDYVVDDGVRSIVQGKVIPNSDKRPQIQFEDRSQLEYIQETQKKIDDYVFDDGDIAIAQSDNSQSQLEYIQETQKKMVEIRSIQQQIIERPRADELFSLLICVDATPKYIGGYCVDFSKKICYCYTYKVDMLPWDLTDKSRMGNPAEFEMKNLLFALLLWEDKIKTCGQVQIHTDNYAIKPYAHDKYGMRASNFLRHLERCEGIQINKNIHINSKWNPEDFAKYITPADDLSRWNIAECQTFLRKVHGIEKFTKSHAIHEQNYNRRTGVASGPSYTRTHNYTEFINKVKSEIRYWNHNPCLNCSFMVKDTTSLRSIVLKN